MRNHKTGKFKYWCGAGLFALTTLTVVNASAGPIINSQSEISTTTSLDGLNAQTQSAVSVYQTYLSNNGKSANYGNGLYIKSNSTNSSNGRKFYTLKQMINGKRVYGSYVKMAVNADGSVFRIVDRTAKYNSSVASTSYPINAALFIGIIPHEFTFGTVYPISSTTSGNVTEYTMSGNKFTGTVNVERVIIADTSGALSEGFVVTSTSVSNNTAFEVLISGSGTTIMKKSLVSDVDRYRIFSKNPAQSAGVVKNGPGNNPGNSHPSPSGWLNLALTQFGANISGQNAIVFMDRDSNGEPDINAVNGASSIVTDQQFVNSPPALRPSPLVNYAGKASAQNAFYHLNFAHDYLKRYGFDEMSGNFQLNNFSNFGEGGDPVIARTQYGLPDSTQIFCPEVEESPNTLLETTQSIGEVPPVFCVRNGAYYYHASDGRSPTILFLTWNSKGFKNPNLSDFRMSSFDSDVIYHEYGHGVTFRLMDEFKRTTPSVAVFEGLSDTYAFLINGDSVIGEYVSGTVGNNVYGIRSHSYHGYQSTGHTLGDFIISSSKSHYNGEIIAAAMWDVFAGPSISEYPEIGSALSCSDVYCGLGREKTMQLLVSALKIVPDSVTFLDVRDAVLLLAEKDDTCAIWQGFAKYGMGVDAVMKYDEDFVLTELSESFQIPTSCPEGGYPDYSYPSYP